MGKKEMFAAARKIISGNTGYDQNERWSFFDRTKKVFVPNREADCSSFCGAVAVMGGYNVDLSGWFYTGNMRAKMSAAGFQVLRFTGLSQLRPGDFVLNELHHVEFVGEDGRFGSASIDENGRATGGKAGNQSGRETRWTSPYLYARGRWDYVLRPAGSSPVGGLPVGVVASQVIAGQWGNGADRVKRLRDAGYNPTVVQTEVNKILAANKPVALPVPKSRIVALQAAVGAVQDSKAGPDTRKRVDAVRKSSRWGGYKFPYGVKYAQMVVKTGQDGSWGPRSIARHDVTVANVQRAVGARVDGIWGPETDRLVNSVLTAYRA